METIDDHLRWNLEECGVSREQYLESLPKGVQMLDCLSKLRAEVNNGGFHQYFWNTGGKAAFSASEGYQLIGAEKHRRLLLEVMGQFFNEEPDILAARNVEVLQMLENFAESCKTTDLNRFDSEFGKLEENEEELKVRYIREHLAEFVF